MSHYWNWTEFRQNLQLGTIVKLDTLTEVYLMFYSKYKIQTDKSQSNHLNRYSVGYSTKHFGGNRYPSFVKILIEKREQRRLTIYHFVASHRSMKSTIFSNPRFPISNSNVHYSLLSNGHPMYWTLAISDFIFSKALHTLSFIWRNDEICFKNIKIDKTSGHFLALYFSPSLCRFVVFVCCYLHTST